MPAQSRLLDRQYTTTTAVIYLCLICLVLQLGVYFVCVKNADVIFYCTGCFVCYFSIVFLHLYAVTDVCFSSSYDRFQHFSLKVFQSISCCLKQIQLLLPAAKAFVVPRTALLLHLIFAVRHVATE